MRWISFDQRLQRPSRPYNGNCWHLSPPINFDWRLWQPPGPVLSLYRHTDRTSIGCLTGRPPPLSHYWLSWLPLIDAYHNHMPHSHTIQYTASFSFISSSVLVSTDIQLLIHSKPQRHVFEPSSASSFMLLIRRIAITPLVRITRASEIALPAKY